MKHNPWDDVRPPNRPLSQYGIPHIRKNPKQRNILEGGVPEKRGRLDAVNDRLADEENRILHPTKGFRKLTAKRTRAAVLAAEIRAGVAPFSMKLMRREMRLATS